METLAKIIESGLIVKLRPSHNRPIPPYLAALCSAGICAAEFPIDNPITVEALKIGCKLFPDLILGVGNVLSVSDCQKAIAAGARYITSTGYSPEIAHLCRGHEILYLPACMTPSELLAVTQNELPAAFLFCPHLWGSPKLIDALFSAFPKLTFLASDVPGSAVQAMKAHSQFSALSLCGLENSTPESLVSQCYQLRQAID